MLGINDMNNIIIVCVDGLLFICVVCEYVVWVVGKFDVFFVLLYVLEKNE